VSGCALPKNSKSQVWDDRRARSLPLLCIAGIAGFPQVSMPIADVDGCPVGLSLIAAAGNDIMLLEIARKVFESKQK
jgi:amidase